MIEVVVGERRITEAELLRVIEVPAAIEAVVAQETIVFESESDVLETDSGHDVETQPFLKEKAMVENNVVRGQKEAKASS